MKTYRITFLEETYYHIDIEAESEEEAIELARDDIPFERFKEGDTDFKLLDSEEL